MRLARNALNWYSRLWQKKNNMKPPYLHVTQIGDPVLRKISEPVDINEIKSEKIQNLIQQLEYVLKKYGSVGMSAPQIGVNLRIFVFHFTKSQLKERSESLIKSQQMCVVPFTVFINPELKVIDYQKILYREGCESIKGLSAEVPRFRKVEVSGFNQEGGVVSNVYSGWAARIVQHEIDHLDGKFYTDVMDRKSLECTCWEEVNRSAGGITLPYRP